MSEHAPEACLQQELRKLHSVIEGTVDKSACAECDRLRAQLEAAQNAVPSNWLDPLLTGPERVGDYPFDEPTIERLLNAIRGRIAAARAEKP